MFDPEERKAREQLAACYRQFALAGLTDLTYNHLSARIPGQPDCYLVKSEHEFFDEVTASSLLKYHLDGRKLSGEGSVSRGGLVIHGGVLEARPDLMAVFHTHTPANMAVSAQKCGLLPLTQHAIRFVEEIGYHESHGFEFDAEGRAALTRDLAGNYILMLSNHGALVCGRTIPEAYIKTHFLEMACRAQIGAMAGGYDNLIIPSNEVAVFGARQITGKPAADENHRDWKASVRQLERLNSNWRD
jgi:ribulose-5-phosphate 4-epimerase/fuculose-1-phosphate aldolase